MELCSYEKTTWIDSTVWRMNSWSVYGSSILTHTRINQRAGRRSLLFYSLVPFFREEADLIPLQFRLVTDGQLDRLVTCKQMATAESFDRLFDTYAAGDLTPCQY
jgi:hypothetical protein